MSVSKEDTASPARMYADPVGGDDSRRVRFMPGQVKILTSAAGTLEAIGREETLAHQESQVRRWRAIQGPIANNSLADLLKPGATSHTLRTFARG